MKTLVHWLVQKLNESEKQNNFYNYENEQLWNYNKVKIGNYLSSSFPIENGLKQGDDLSPLLFNFALEYAIRKVQETNLGLDMNGTHQVLAYADDVNLIGDDIKTI